MRPKAPSWVPDWGSTPEAAERLTLSTLMAWNRRPLESPTAVVGPVGSSTLMSSNCNVLAMNHVGLREGTCGKQGNWETQRIVGLTVATVPLHEGLVVGMPAASWTLASPPNAAPRKKFPLNMMKLQVLVECVDFELV